MDVDRGALPDGGGCCCAMRIRRTAGGCAKRDENNTDHCEWRSLNHYLRPLPLMTDDSSARLRPRVTPVRCDSCNCSSVAVMRAPHPSRRSALQVALDYAHIGHGGPPGHLHRDPGTNLYPEPESPMNLLRQPLLVKTSTTRQGRRRIVRGGNAATVSSESARDPRPRRGQRVISRRDGDSHGIPPPRTRRARAPDVSSVVALT